VHIPKIGGGTLAKLGEITSALFRLLPVFLDSQQAMIYPHINKVRGSIMAMRYFGSVLVLGLIAAWGIDADAGIGRVGSVQEKPEQEEPVAASQAQEEQPVTKEEEEKPLMVIRFPNSQRHVYFERQVRQAVRSTEETVAGVHYEVVSYVPADGASSKSKVAIRRYNEQTRQNLSAIANELANNGIDASSISTSTVQVPTGNAQEIKIFVRNNAQQPEVPAEADVEPVSPAVP
jgi:hypothetical protein